MLTSVDDVNQAGSLFCGLDLNIKRYPSNVISSPVK